MQKKLLYAVSLLLVLFAAKSTAANSDIFNITTPKRVVVHDPSVVVGYSKDGKITGENSSGAKKVYYIFGSHRAWAKSNNLQDWTTFTNNLSTNYATILQADAAWASRGGKQGGAAYNVAGNMWAPDVVWNKAMKKWCMYMSVNGDNFYSSIVMLTAESLDGNWTRVGTVVYSGFINKTEAQSTDFYKVYSGTDFPSRYTQKGKYTLNAIDPCAFYDNDGNLWMTYGSWFGGLYMLRLDNNTGLRNYSYTYPTTDGTAAGATSDVYLGHKVAGGNGVSGEASYIKYIGGKYYLFVTYGGLDSKGGYNMRVFSADNVKGPYTDLAGRSSIYSSSNTSVGNLKSNSGIQLMNYYKWNLMDYGYVAEGHNSAMTDDDGKSYIVYHTRSTAWGEGHEVRVHQVFAADNGGIVAAPFEYRGETLATTPYPANEVTGTYNIIYHDYTDFTKLVCNTEKQIILNADGTVDGNYRGTWSQAKDSPYITINFTRFGEMKGVLLKQKMEGLNYESLCFSIIGKGNIPMWGYKNVDSVIADATSGLGGDVVSNVLARYSTSKQFNDATASTEITPSTGLSLSFYVSGLASDWDVVAKSTDDKFRLHLSVLHYGGSDFYEAKATVSAEAAAAGYTSANIWEAFLKGNYYVTVSYNTDGSIAYYRNGKLMLTYSSGTTPSWNDPNVSGSAAITPRDISKAVINYYNNGQLDFSRQVYNIVVGYSVPYDKEHPSGIIDVNNNNHTTNKSHAVYNLRGQRVDNSYRGIVIINGKKYVR